MTISKRLSRRKRSSKSIPEARFIASSPNKRILSAIVKPPSNDLTKVISNAALNVLRGPVYIKPHDKPLLRRHVKILTQLASKKVPLSKKRKTIQRGGGIFALLPILLSTVLSTFGSRFFANNSDTNN